MSGMSKKEAKAAVKKQLEADKILAVSIQTEGGFNWDLSIKASIRQLIRPWTMERRAVYGADIGSLEGHPEKDL